MSSSYEELQERGVTKSQLDELENTVFTQFNSLLSEAGLEQPDETVYTELFEFLCEYIITVVESTDEKSTTEYISKLQNEFGTDQGTVSMRFLLGLLAGEKSETKAAEVSYKIHRNL